MPYPDDAMFLLFQRELPDNRGMLPFSYSECYFYAYDSARPQDDVNRNLQEWIEFAGSKTLKPRDIYTLQYDMSPYDFEFRYLSKDWKGFKTNTFVNWLTRTENKEAYNYFRYAKKVEDMIIPSSNDPWQEKVFQLSKAINYPIIDKGLLMAELSKNRWSERPEFLKERYAFQAVKLMYYQKYNSMSINDPDISLSTPVDDTDLIKCYDKWLKGKNTIVADWGQLYYALSHSDTAARALNLLQSFDRCEDKKMFIFNHLSRADLELKEVMPRDAQTRAAKYAYCAMKRKDKALSEIKSLYNVMPKSPYIKVVVGREVNKLEDWILSYEVKNFQSNLKSLEFHNKYNRDYNDFDTTYDYYVSKNLAKDKVYLREFRQYLESIVSKKSPNHDFLMLAIAHLYNMDKDYASALKYLDRLPHQPNKKMEIQRQVEKTIAIIYSAKVNHPAIQTQLEQQFLSLERLGLKQDTLKEYEEYESPGNLLSELYLLLSEKLKKDSDIVLASLYFKKARNLVNDYYNPTIFNRRGKHTCSYGDIAYFDKFGAAADIDSFLSFKHKTRKTAFEKRALPSFWPDENFCKDVKATILIRQGRIEEALAVVQTIPDIFWRDNYDFGLDLKSTNITSLGVVLPVNTGKGKNYSYVSKRAILRDIVGIRAAITNTTDSEQKARNYFYLANCYFNMTYYGKDWQMFSYGWSCCENNSWHTVDWWTYAFNPTNLQYSKIYFECTWAKEMYLKALNLTHKKELAASCMVMLGKIDNDAHHYRDILAQRQKGIYKPWKTEEMPYYSKWWKIAKQKYAHTAVFERLADECPDIQAFLEPNKK